MNKDERKQKLIELYATYIDKIEGESYKETCKRLRETIGEKIQESIFHDVVKYVRNK